MGADGPQMGRSVVPRGASAADTFNRYSHERVFYSFMGLFTGVWMAVLGTLGGSSYVVAKRPDAQDLIDQLAPYQGWIGAVSALWGFYMLINQVLFRMSWMAEFPIRWWTMTANGALMAALGLLLGVGVMKSFSSSPEANEKLDETVEKLSPYQVTLGLVGIGLGLWTIVQGLLL